jgi:hypothetical protein
MKIQDVKIGDKLVADDSFTCLDKGEICVVKGDKFGKYVDCRTGKHTLYGQVGSAPNYDDDELIGFIRP